MTTKLTCLMCDQPATWVRSTQFAGDHPFCEAHAKLESDFGECDSYAQWYEPREPEYETATFEQAEPFWAERNRLLRLRSQALVVALVGKAHAELWWASPNRAFEMQTPLEQFDRNAERVYGYLMQSAEGTW
jgi:hypothetical protein